MKYKTVRKIKKKPIIILSIIVIFIIALISLILYINHINKDSYKLEKIGYNKDEITLILKRNKTEINDILKKKYDKNIPLLLKEKYILYKNLDSDLDYIKDNKLDKLTHVVSIVNVKANYDHYDEDIIKKTDTSKGNLMLVNKFNYLDSTYVPNDITNIPLTYAFSDNQATKEVLSAFKNMWQKAKSENLNLIVNSSYRDYESQENVWNNYEARNGEEYADSIAARPGYSEHQTGLALDIITYGANKNTFEDTDEFKWLQKNAHKYGFILRYPKDKEDITGYEYESWHYRYVGVEAATEIHNKKITYDEYYAYYVGE